MNYTEKIPSIVLLEESIATDFALIDIQLRFLCYIYSVYIAQKARLQVVSMITCMHKH